MTLPALRSHIACLPRYQPGGHRLASGRSPIILSANENPHGASPRAQAALASPLPLHRYPDLQDSEALKRALVDYCRREEEGKPEPRNILIGNGSDEIIALLIQAFAEPEDKGIVCQHSFPLYELALRAAQAQVCVAPRRPEQDFRLDIETLCALCDARTKLLFLANPDNPTGRIESCTFLEDLRARLPSHVLLVLDSAYAEYSDDEDYDSGIELARRSESVVVLRTFSKIHGLAALRLGWGVASPRIVEALERIRMPFSVNALALRAGVAALQDESHLAMSRRENRRGLTRLYEHFHVLQRHGLQRTEFRPYPSQANFLLLEGASEASACRFEQHLRANDILVRRCHANALPHCLRITIGTEREVSALLAALPSAS